jgi:hypothetical protein
MAITFLGANVSGISDISGVCTVSVPISNNDTVLVAVRSDPSALLLGPTDSGGTTYNFLGALAVGNLSLDLYASAPAGAVASTSVSCSISPAFTDLVMIVARYSGVSAFGAASSNGGTSANPNITLSTTAANSFMLAGFAGSAAQVDTALTGNLRQAIFLSGNTNDTVSLVDNTSASPAALTAAVTNVASSWVAVAVEMFAAGPAVPSEDSWMPPFPSVADPNISVW